MSDQEQRRFGPLLDGLGLTLSWANSLQKAQQQMTTGPEPAAIVIDADWKGFEWRQALESLAQGDGDAAFLLCTSEPGSGDMLTASRKAPISDVIVKPYDRELVRSRVMHALSAPTNKPVQGAGAPSHPAE